MRRRRRKWRRGRGEEGEQQQQQQHQQQQQRMAWYIGSVGIDWISVVIADGLRQQSDYFYCFMDCCVLRYGAHGERVLFECYCPEDRSAVILGCKSLRADSSGSHLTLGTAWRTNSYWLIQQKNNLRGLSPWANYTDRATAACRRS
jgi:hypothetical protein